MRYSFQFSFSAFWAAVVATCFFASVTVAKAQDAPRIVATIKPVHSLVSGVMHGVGEPVLILDGTSTPHAFSLTPSQARQMQQAQIVFWIGPAFETSLVKPLGTLASRAKTVSLAQVSGLEKLAYREDESFDGHEHHGVEDDHDDTHGAIDLHLWLDPQNAALMVQHIAETLSAFDPANASAYQANARQLKSKLKALEMELKTRLANVTGKPFFVFHDAYHYFEHRFGIEAKGVIALNPNAAPGIARVRQLRSKVESHGAVCLFSEPQFSRSALATITQDTNAKTATLDPLGATLKNGSELYFDLLRNLASTMQNCLESI